MEHITKIEIVNALNAYMAEHKMTQADVSSKSGVRKEYVSMILKPGSNFMYSSGDVQGFIPAKHFNALASLCGFATEKVYWQTQPTAQANSIFANLQDAKAHHLTALFRIYHS